MKTELDKIDELLAMLAESGTVATQEQAQNLAIRVAGSVSAYIVDLKKTRHDIEKYQPLGIPESELHEKFKDALSYEITPPQIDQQ